MNAKAIFDTVRPWLDSKGFTPDRIAALDAAIAGEVKPAPSGRVLSQAGVDLIKQFEGMELKAYPDPGSGGEPWTIGIGHTGGVRPGDVITEARAEQLLRQDVGRFEKAVNKLAPRTTQNQFDAMVSLAFNVGEGNLAKSSVIRKHNAGDFAGAAQSFALWNKAAGRVMAGLTRRRAAEASLYRSGS